MLNHTTLLYSMAWFRSFLNFGLLADILVSSGTNRNSGSYSCSGRGGGSGSGSNNGMSRGSGSGNGRRGRGRGNININWEERRRQTPRWCNTAGTYSLFLFDTILYSWGQCNRHLRQETCYTRWETGDRKHEMWVWRSERGYMIQETWDRRLKT